MRLQIISMGKRTMPWENREQHPVIWRDSYRMANCGGSWFIVIGIVDCNEQSFIRIARGPKLKEADETGCPVRQVQRLNIKYHGIWWWVIDTMAEVMREWMQGLSEGHGINLEAATEEEGL